MTVAVAPVPGTSLAPAGGFYAFVKSVHTGLFSSKVNCLFVEILSGSIERSDPVEIFRADGTRTTIVGTRIRKGLGELVLDLEDPHPDKSYLAGAAIARTPGLAAPSFPDDGDPRLERLLEASRNARALGFPVDWAQPIKPIAGLTPEWLSARLRMLPDEAVALVVLHRIQDATGHHDNPFDVMGDAATAAMHLNAIGLHEDGDRLLLEVAAVVRGHASPPALRAAASAGALGVLATEDAAESGLKLGRNVGWALGIEMGDAFAKRFQSGVAAGGEVVENALLEANRAVGVAWCKSCRDVVQLRYGKSGLTGSPQLRCPADNRKIDDPMLVVPADAHGLQEALRQQRR